MPYFFLEEADGVLKNKRDYKNILIIQVWNELNSYVNFFWYVIAIDEIYILQSILVYYNL